MHTHACTHTRTCTYTHALHTHTRTHTHTHTQTHTLQVRCSNKPKGCKWIGALEQLSDHLESGKGCGYIEIECSNRCMESIGFTVMKIKRKDLENHLKNECYLRACQCKYCGYENTYIAITGESKGRDTLKRSSNHYEICPEIPLECPNKCGVKDIKRKQLKDHHEKCPRERVACPFEEAGCKEQFVRRDVEKHVTTNQYQHMLLVMKGFEKMKRDLKEHKAQIAEMTKVMSVDTKCLRVSSDLKLTCSSALASIETHLGSRELKVYDSFLVFRMIEFPQYKESGQVWHGLPFYLCIPQLKSPPSKYKMCLAVNASGVGSGSGTHVSISLLLLPSEHDTESKWPFDYGEDSDGELTIQLLPQKGNTDSEVLNETNTIYCGLALPYYKSEEVYQVETAWGHRVLVTEDKFVSHDLIDNGYLYEESLLWRVVAPGILD